ncbi:3-ketoacyl-CoA synthase 17 [Actinidia rufa]|uniref:3-ketoacyl-CoA synthase 17 n=1 Tax=Actinidia rufa TaxID=165716 RepID=A0A7J0ETN7_9ERIC|nr:3-ketoacyl-CoA synthase 17 [Actinidia rufa]
MAEREGVGLNKLQFTISIPMSFGLILVETKRLSRAVNITVSASSRAAAMEGRGGRQCIASGTEVSSPRPDRSRIFRWNSSDDSSKSPVSFECSMKRRNVAFRWSGGAVAGVVHQEIRKFNGGGGRWLCSGVHGGGNWGWGCCSLGLCGVRECAVKEYYNIYIRRGEREREKRVRDGCGIMEVGCRLGVGRCNYITGRV